MNEFPKRSNASISKQTKQHILQIKKSKSKIKIFLSAVQASVPEVSMYKILNEEQEQGLWETLASMTYPQLLLIWLKIPIRT
jgi:hypothetical protein